MGLHKLTAGDGYTYLTRQVAAHDATERGHAGLDDYYAEKGESPGTWWGSGLASLALHEPPVGAVDAAVLEVPEGSTVSEAQMLALFGEGRHPNADVLERAAIDADGTTAQALAASQLGRLFAVYDGAPAFHRELAARYSEWNHDHGALWRTPVPPEIRARIRTGLADEWFVEEHGRAPLNDRERAGHLAKLSRQGTSAVAGYDLTFTPVKSVSVLWALAPPEIAAQVRAGHDSAVTRTLAYLEGEVLFTRRGRGGVQQVPTRGMLAARFTHRDSRAGDPNLHTHVALSNKVQDQDGRWLAVDGRVLHKATVMLSETYNTYLEAELTARLGVRFADRGTHRGTAQGHDARRERRAVREVVGVDPRLAGAWSSRSAAIEARRRDLAAAFQRDHGRPTTPVESLALAQQATLETRQAKHEPRSEAEQQATWRAAAEAVLGGADRVDAMLAGTLEGPRQRGRLSRGLIDDIARDVVERVATDRATWQIWHLRAEAMRQLRARDATAVAPDVLGALRDAVVEIAITDRSVPIGGPSAAGSQERSLARATPTTLRRPDGTPVYDLHGAQLYTSPAVLDAEQRVLAAARRTDGHRISGVRVGVALAETAANGTVLNASQAAMVRELATSGRRVQLGLAPAGTGKTTAMRALAQAWTDAGGTIVGLAPSAVAAHELREALAPDATSSAPGRAAPSRGTCETLSKLVHHLRKDSLDRAPDWVREVGPRTLLVIDEAGMAPTTDLADAIDHAINRGASVRLVGDDRQLAAVGAGGILRDIATDDPAGPLSSTGGAVTLSEVMRFHDGAEATATLAIRDGDHTALGFYTDRDRIHVGDLTTATDHAFAAWQRDRQARKTTLMLAPTRDLVAELNTKARNQRLADLTAQASTTAAAVLELADGTHASPGDTVITRRNDRALRLTSADWVKNGDRWTIQDIHPDGSAHVRHDRLGRSVLLPATYVAEHLQLGYATTIHGAQGTTVDTAHLVLTGDEDRNLLYVGLTRGREANHLYLAAPLSSTASGAGDPHNAIRPEALLPPTPSDQLGRILDRDGTATSATTEQQRAADPFTRLRHATLRYHDALTHAAEQTLGDDVLSAIEQAANTWDRLPAGLDDARDGCSSLTDAPAWPTLRAHLALATLDAAPIAEPPASSGLHGGWHGLSHELPAHVTAQREVWQTAATRMLKQLAERASLHDAADPAAVLDHRLEQLLADRSADAESHDPRHRTASTSRTQRPLAWLPGVPTALAADRDWGPYLHAASEAVTGYAAAIRAATTTWTSTSAPVWAAPYLNGPPEDEGPLVADLAVWRAAHDVPDGDRRPTGRTLVGAPGDYQRDLDHRARQQSPAYQYRQRRWYAALPDPVRDDPWHQVLCQRLGRLERAGLDPETLVRDALEPADAGPLPDEHSAAALWWRLVPHLGPAALAADDHTADLLRPDWLPEATAATSPRVVDELRHAPLWPALVAAVDETLSTARSETTDGEREPWTPTTLLTTAFDGLPLDLRDAELCEALVLRIATLTDAPRAPRPAATASPAAASAVSPAQPASASARPASGTPRTRIVELHDEALRFYGEHAARSWVPAYLTDRFGDLAYNFDAGAQQAGSPVTVGYAPPGPRSLLIHLTAQGASAQELLDAGLIRERTGRTSGGTATWIDAFRDRLVLPIRTPDGEIVGFIGRRNPTKTDDDYAGPKYLNTRTTTAFAKSETLFGYAEALPHLRTGALPVLVEGPFDAHAITWATTHLPPTQRAVGIAPMGTALTDRQIALLAPWAQRRVSGGRGKGGLGPSPTTSPSPPTTTPPAHEQHERRTGTSLPATLIPTTSDSPTAWTPPMSSARTDPRHWPTRSGIDGR
ncbi:MobF family relaxase [Nocardioides zeae]